MGRGYIGKILFVDMTSGSIREEVFPEKFYRDFLGGYGLGVKILYERMRPDPDPLGPDNMIGFAPGILTATGAPMSSRYEVFARSPLTRAWGQCNSGGHFGQELKAAGYDALFFNGISPVPVYLSIQEGKAELRDATHLWGKDTVETETILQNQLGDKKVRVACIGPSGESLSLISCVINDKGRAAARSGLGAVMGSKLLKAIAVRGRGRIAVADPKQVKDLNRSFVKSIQEAKDATRVLIDYGTCGLFLDFLYRGDAPIKNWILNGIETFPTAYKLHKDNVTQYQVKKFACSGCPIGCGGIVKVEGGLYDLAEGHKPEYETLASFGSLCLNDDIESIIKANDICNRYGLDTISVGTCIAFAIECYENGIINQRETDGLDLTWGNGPAIVALTDKLARREGFGDILADGVVKAAQHIGRGAEQYAMHVHGQEPGCRDPRLIPSRGVGYIADSAPGRHTASTIQVMFEQGGAVGNYPELRAAQRELKGSALYAVANKYQAMVSSAGLCTFSAFPGIYPVIELISAVTGWDFTLEEALRTGHRIQTLRQAFIIRDGIPPKDFQLPERMSKRPSEGPLANKTRDFNELNGDFYEAMGWEREGDRAGYPLKQTLKELGLDKVATNG